MSTQRNNTKQSLQVKANNRTPGVDNRPYVAARYRLPKVKKILYGRRHNVDKSFISSNNKPRLRWGL